MCVGTCHTSLVPTPTNGLGMRHVSHVHRPLSPPRDSLNWHCMRGLYRSSDAGTNVDQNQEILFTYQVLQPSVKLSPVLYRRPPTVHVPVGGVAVAVVVAVGGMV